MRAIVATALSSPGQVQHATMAQRASSRRKRCLSKRTIHVVVSITRNAPLKRRSEDIGYNLSMMT